MPYWGVLAVPYCDTGNAHKAIERGSGNQKPAFIGWRLNVGNDQRARILLVIPDDKKVQLVFDDRSAQRKTELVGRERNLAFVAPNIVLDSIASWPVCN